MNKHSRLLFLILIIVVFVSIGIYLYLDYNVVPKVTNISIDENNNVIIDYSYPFFKRNTNTKCGLISENGEEWNNSSNDKCTFQIKEFPYNIYLKNNNGIKLKIKNPSLVNLVNNKIYLATGEEYKLSYNIDSSVSLESSNNEVAIITDGKIVGINDGESFITVKSGFISKRILVVVTSLILKRTSEFDFNKNYLKCQEYTSEEATLLDNILFAKVREVGYKTRAGAVEAARFLTLDFAYRIRYFGASGRMEPIRKYQVDGEGRYYHEGLYISEDKYETIIKKKYGPKMWGCPLSNVFSDRPAPNGFDCSGFVSWVLKNGGFDPGDIGAGITNVYDLTDTGERIKMTPENIKKMQVGDLLSGPINSGGHIGIVIGITDTNIYVAESYSGKKAVGVVASKYSHETFFNSWKWLILMDNYYQNQGKVTTMWEY